jgi:membrane-bound ClpP family serine protease
VDVTFSRLIAGASTLSREDWACIGFIILGIILFLIGANYYNAVVGWLGVLLFLGGILILLGLYVYNVLSKPKPQKETVAEVSEEVQNP